MPVTISNQRRLNNFIDKNFQDMLLPLNTILSVLQIPIYNCSDGFITPRSRRQKLKSIMMNVFLLIAVYFRFSLPVVDASIADSIIIFTYYFDLLYCSLGLSAMCIGNIINTYNYVNILLNLQKAFRTIRCTEKVIRRLTLWNWISMVIFILGYYTFTLLALTLLCSMNIMALLLNFLPFILLDISVVYTTRVLWIIKDGLSVWVEELKGAKRSAGVQKVFDSYRLVLDAFALFNKVSFVTIAFLIGDIFCHTLMYLQVNMILKKQQAEISLAQFVQRADVISIIISISKNYLLLCIICYALDTFYLHVKHAEEICSAAIPDVRQRRQLCKNVRRYTNARFRHQRVCGVRVDARLPLRLAGALTAYIAVLLQFNL